MKSIKNLFLVLALAFAPFAANAAGNATGTVGTFYAAQGSTLLVYLSASVSTPSCAQAARMAIDTSTADGANKAAAIRFAAALGKTVTLIGAGTCNATFTDTETVLSLAVSL